MKTEYVRDLKDLGRAIMHIRNNITFYSRKNDRYIYTMLEIGDHVMMFYTRFEEQAWDAPVQWLVANGYLERGEWL